ncbi:MAG: nuclear transport factor 2 family protein [Gemmatimonadota bacterium]|nr:nuclear transport factor 2 family protein [Gemmatimonadota bacterium]
MRPVSRVAVQFVSLLASLAALAGVSTESAAQSADHDAAYAVVKSLFESMRARDTSAMRAAFVPNASMQSLTPTGVTFVPVDDWIRSVAGAPASLVLDERVANPVVHVDGDLANIWVEYWFFAGERLSHCGVDAFLLARRDGAWKIFSVVDTRRRDGCAPAPGPA